MERYFFNIVKNSLVIEDLQSKGFLHIFFSPYKKPLLSPAFEAWNDIETSIKRHKLSLQLTGHSFIKEIEGFNLKGDVSLMSSHFCDCIIENSSIRNTVIKPQSLIKNSELSHVGFTYFGKLDINDSVFTQTPPSIPGRYRSYRANKLVSGD